VRQEEGLSYGVGAFFTAQSLDDRATLGMYAIMNPANIAKVEQAISQELQKMRDKGISDDELKAAQTGWLESQKVERSDDATLTRVLNSTLEAERNMQYYENLEQSVLGLTVEAVDHVWKQNVNPDRIPVAIAGDMTKAEAAKAPAGEGK